MWKISGNYYSRYVAIHDYNQFINDVDRSDQMLACHNVSKKCYRWWKTLLFNLVHIAIVNSFILFLCVVENSMLM